MPKNIWDSAEPPVYARSGLGSTLTICTVHARPVTVWLSRDGKTWEEAGMLKYENGQATFHFPPGTSARYIALGAKPR